jgi:ATP-dependent Clp protease adaptor protein ClpS
MSDEGTITIPLPKKKTREKEDVKKLPPYNVILLNDDDHSYEYVIHMLQSLFGHPPERGFQLAKEVDSSGRVIVLTTSKEHAELKRDQIHAFGPDPLIQRCKGSMSATIEPAPG